MPFVSDGMKLLLLPVPLVVIVWGYRRLRANARWALAKDDASHAAVGPMPALPLGVGFVLR